MPETDIRAPRTTTLLRVDVAGVPVFVRGQDAYEHLVHVNQKLAIAKLALHKIKASAQGIGPTYAARALEEMKSV